MKTADDHGLNLALARGGGPWSSGAESGVATIATGKVAIR